MNHGEREVLKGRSSKGRMGQSDPLLSDELFSLGDMPTDVLRHLLKSRSSNKNSCPLLTKDFLRNLPFKTR